jgi:hypothetical protein
MDSASYPDPLGEALSHSSQRAAQFASLMGAMAQVAWQRKVLADAKNVVRGDQRAEQVVRDQEARLHRQARLNWAPAHDRQWLAQADLLQTARVWGSAAAYADADPVAASALRKCEDRLRTLHPYAMARYNRLRADGVDPFDAMRETVPLFGRASHVRTGDPAAPRSALNISAGQDAEPSAGQAPGSAGELAAEPDAPSRIEARGQQIVERLQATVRAAGRSDLGPGQLAVVLEALTNLPDNVIKKLASELATEGQTENGRRAVGADAPHADAGRSAAQLAAESFPHSSVAVVRTAGAGKTAPGPAAAPVRAPEMKRPPRPTL